MTFLDFVRDVGSQQLLNMLADCFQAAQAPREVLVSAADCKESSSYTVDSRQLDELT
jgi:hypothetical protein